MLLRAWCALINDALLMCVNDVKEGWFKGCEGAYSALSERERVVQTFRAEWSGCHVSMRERESTCICIDIKVLPAVRRVLEDRGILWILRLLSGRTYPAVPWVQTHHRCPVGRGEGGVKDH